MVSVSPPLHGMEVVEVLVDHMGFPVRPGRLVALVPFHCPVPPRFSFIPKLGMPLRPPELLPLTPLPLTPENLLPPDCD